MAEYDPPSPVTSNCSSDEHPAKALEPILSQSEGSEKLLRELQLLKAASPFSFKPKAAYDISLSISQFSNA